MERKPLQFNSEGSLLSLAGREERLLFEQGPGGGRGEEGNFLLPLLKGADGEWEEEEDS